MIYISGPITDKNPIRQKEHLTRFYETERVLNALGFQCFNPARLEQEGWTWEKYLARDIMWIHNNKPTMYMMRGWENSLGAKTEWETAQLLGLKIIYE